MATCITPLGAIRASSVRAEAAKRPCFLARRPMKPLGARKALIGAPLFRKRVQLAPRNAIQHAVCAAAPLENPFKYPREMDGLQSVLSGLPTAAVYALGAALVAALGGGASLAASNVAPATLRTAGTVAGGLVGGTIGALISKQLLDKRQSAAIIELSNLLVAMGDPTQLTREQVEGIEAKYGVKLAQQATEGVKLIYGTFVEALIPSGDTPLRGTEHVLIQSFKAALGLDDVDAAPVHIDVGRRILRGRLEAGSRGEDFEARKAFQKLIYVSNLVFGDRQAAFLLPWARVFALNDAQVYVAKRDNARLLFKAFIDRTGGLQGDVEFLRQLKQVQEQVRLVDEEAETVVKEAARARIEANLDRALECIKRRTRVRDFSDALRELRSLIDFNRALGAARADPAVVRGLGLATVAGGKFEGEGKDKDLRELFKIFLEESMTREGAYTDALESDTADLKTALQLGTKEAASIENEIKEKVYRSLLREEFTSGRLEAAPSKAAVLAGLTEKVRFDEEAAKELHRSLYRQKLSSLLEKKALTDEDESELARLQRMLCIPAAERNEMHKELCGSIFKDVVNRALSAGVDHFGFEDRNAVRKAFNDLRLERPAARQILDTVARKYFMQYITKSRTQRNRLDSAKELKKLVFFSNVCVTPLLEDLKTEDEKKAEQAAAEQQKQLMEMLRKAQADADKKKPEEAAAAPAAAAAEGAEQPAQATDSETQQQPAEAAEAAAAAAAPASEGEQPAAAEANEEVKEAVAEVEAQPASLQKAKVAAAERAAGETLEGTSTVMKAQKDITLREDLEQRDRLDTYRNFLLYCMTGDVVQGPMGVTMVTERNESEFARLSQLGDILGLSQVDVNSVHQGLAEQAFKEQVKQMMADGNLTPDRATQLEGLRERMGLPKEAADKIIRGFSNQRLIASMQAAKAQGNLTLERVLELKEGGVEIGSLLTEDNRQQLYRGEVLKRLTDGSGSFDAQRFLEDLPKELEIDAKKAQKTVTELAKDRKRTTLVQAISLLRQKKLGDSAKELNNLLSCEAAVPSPEPAKWQAKEELQDLYSAYLAMEHDAAKRDGVAKLLGISESDAANLAAVVESGQFKLGQEAAKEAEAWF